LLEPTYKINPTFLDL